VREIAVAHSKGDSAIVVGLRNNAFCFVLACSALIGTIGCLAIWTTNILPDLSERIAMTLMLIILPMSTLIRLSAAIMSGIRQISWAQVIELFLLPSIILAGLLAIAALGFSAFDVTVPMTIYLCGSVVSLAIVVYLVRKMFSQFGSAGVSPARIQGLQRRGVPFLLIGAASVVTGQLDTVIVGSFLENQDTALYRVAAQGATLIWFGLQILQSISSPYFARLHHSGDYGNLKRLFVITTVMSTISAIPIFAIFVIFGEKLISFSFGIDYVGAHHLLVILSIGYTINVCCGPIGAVLSMIGKERFVSKALIASYVFNILMSFFLVQAFGATGVAISTSFSIAFYHVILRVYGWRYCGL
jgi:O-antigen/teichoic acid export membrane protein